MADEYISKQDAIELCNNPLSEQSMRLIPPADVAPVVHGEWLPTNDDNKKRCNKCDMVVLIAMYPSGSANFCPNCGAKMDGKE